MSHTLAHGQKVHAQTWDEPCAVAELLGGGGQGEVYACRIDGRPFALKWYFPHYVRQAPRLRDRLEWAVKEGPPSDRFLWPLDLATAGKTADSFGYVMKL